MKFAAKLFLLYEKSVQHKKACEAGTKENKTKGFFKEEKIMVVVLKPDTKEEQIENLKVWLSSMGISTHISRGVNHTIVGLVGDTSVVDMDLVRALDIVENVQRIQEPFKNANRKFHNADQVVDIAGVKIGGGNFQIIAGPCSVESEAQVCEIAERVKAAGAGLLRGGAFKPRTSPYAFQGLKGDGLKLLVEAKQLTGLPIVSEIMNAVHIPMFEESVDLVQVGARNMQNFELLKEAGKSGMPVLLKRGLCATIDEWLNAAEYIISEGNPNIVLCERGIRTYETSTRNTLDISAIPVIRQKSHLPVIVDPSHATGVRAYVEPLAKAAVAVGADGLMIEVHPDPAKALSDGPQSLTFEQFDSLTGELRPYAELSGRKF